MTTAKERRDTLPPDGVVPPEGIEVRPGVWFHPRSPDASPERLRQLLGSIKLNPPLTLRELHALIHDEEDEAEEYQDAGT